jgi:chromate transporter
MGITSFGGGLLAHFRANLVRLPENPRGWLSDEEFLELWSVGQILPGLNSLNVTVMVADRLAGPMGVLVALTSFLLPGFLTILAYAVWLLGNTSHLAESIQHSVAAAATGLLLATLAQLARSQVRNGLDFAIAAVTFMLIRLAHWKLLNLFLVMVPVTYFLQGLRRGKA